MRSIILIAHDIRSTHNVGSLLRTADGFGVEHIYFTGYTPYPQTKNDGRLPHITQKLTQQIDKTALGAIDFTSWSHENDIHNLLRDLKQANYTIVGLEQSKKAQMLTTYKPTDRCALLLGSEVTGIDTTLLDQCDDIVEIELYGKKESLNVVQATAIALYALREA